MFRKSALFVSWLFLCYRYSITFIFWQIFPDSEMRANRDRNPDKKETTVWWMGIHALICVYVRFCQRLCLKSTRINFGNACLYRLSTFCKTLKKERVFAFDSNSYFSRPSLRLLEGAKQLKKAILQNDKEFHCKRY